MSFEDLVAQALDELPEPFAGWLNNVSVVVAAEPGPAGQGPDTLGLYQGIPLSERGAGYTFVLPDKITLFEDPLRRTFPDGAELREQVRRTVIHELAHHFGIDDTKLQELGWA